MPKSLFLRCLGIFSLLLFSTHPAASAEGSLFAWRTSTPGEFGLSDARLEGAWRSMARMESTTFLVIRSDHIVFERHAPGYDRNKSYPAASSANFSPDGVARIGRILLHHDHREERPFISEEAVRKASSEAGLPNYSGQDWTVNRRPDGSRVMSQLPLDAFWALGEAGQFLLLVPSLDLIVLRDGKRFSDGNNPLRRIEKLVVNPVMEAFVRQAVAPYPPSEWVSGIEWSSVDTILRLAPGGDNWPSTWADDDALYTAYGDGNGFEPQLQNRLSLGFARIEGMPPAIHPSNVRSPTGEQSGDGAEGRKASGLLMVNGTLYLLARNAGNAQLAWSNDHGATWTWVEWAFKPSFGCPTFVQFGKNYANARDDYVYVFSPDAETAYRRADRAILARVPKDRIRNLNAYEYFVVRDAEGGAHWTKAISERGAVFEDRGAVYRSHISWHPGLHRYLLTVIGRGEDTRFAGGFAVYDAPEPWGPWTTVAYYDTWDVGPGESNHFPSKWMERDGAWLVFSGEDSFSARHARFVLRQTSGK